MNDNNCPVCNSGLLTKEVSPCMDCGRSEPGSSYTEYEVYFNQRLVLCNFCAVDFGSYKPAYFGFPNDRKIGLHDFNFVREIIDKSLRTDKYCPNCRKGVEFMKFVRYCREQNLK